MIKVIITKMAIDPVSEYDPSSYPYTGLFLNSETNNILAVDRVVKYMGTMCIDDSYFSLNDTTIQGTLESVDDSFNASLDDVLKMIAVSQKPELAFKP